MSSEELAAELAALRAEVRELAAKLALLESGDSDTVLMPARLELEPQGQASQLG